MLAPLYPIANTPATITVASPGALAAATSVPVAALTIALPVGYIVDFGTSKFAKLAAAATIDDVSLTTAALPLALTAGNTATIPGSSASTILSEEFTKLAADKQLAMTLLAHELLELRAPAYTGDDAERLAFAVVLQVNFMVAQKLTPKVQKSTSTTTPGNATAYRDRWLNPDAAAIVEAVTGRRQVRFTPPATGV